MLCPSRRSDNPAENRFCDQCGEPLEARCPQGAAMLTERWNDAITESIAAVAIARTIEYPTLAWQAAYVLARAQAKVGKLDDAAATARVAMETLDQVVARAPEPALQQTFTNWARVQTAREDLERILR